MTLLASSGSLLDEARLSLGLPDEARLRLLHWVAMLTAVIYPSFSSSPFSTAVFVGEVYSPCGGLLSGGALAVSLDFLGSEPPDASL